MSENCLLTLGAGNDRICLIITYRYVLVDSD